MDEEAAARIRKARDVLEQRVAFILLETHSNFADVGKDEFARRAQIAALANKDAGSSKGSQQITKYAGQASQQGCSSRK
ncbi:uncharacterized protein SPSK_00634 [Sporothrix schenckii 1099-18]|uniref:Uncharacterized protein n=1 Tax=Sporothrix schenckii 1099-18 TaxID=1397361 RepID=A0A0F2LQU3_SPOSC|nr:uncharacterized protein SPSK_00634 [Sporothrix schenckii 1099-18]KJR79887.1 hypothetical protein SPSK_00634 [Sporothrix schenckii 1099-18]